MSLNRTLQRLFDEVRREAKTNPAFADRLDAALRAHASRRDVSEETQAAVESSPPLGDADQAPPPEINPVGLFQRDGADGLKAALNDHGLGVEALRALIEEHNLDPGGEAEELDRAGLVAHIVANAERRVERDRKMFDY